MKIKIWYYFIFLIIACSFVQFACESSVQQNTPSKSLEQIQQEAMGQGKSPLLPGQLSRESGPIRNLPGGTGESIIRAKKWTTAQGVIKVSLPKQDIVVKINQIDNNDFPNITLYVSVTDPHGAPLELEDKNEFYIEENDSRLDPASIKYIEQQKITNLTTPLNIILCLDKSGSMANDGARTNTPVDQQPLTYVKEAAVDFIRHIKVDDTVDVIAFDGDIHNLGSNVDAIEKIQSLEPRGATALYGVLYKSVMRLKDRTGIKAVVLMSDGKNDLGGTIQDEIKKITLDQGIDTALKMNIPVFTIAFGADADISILQKMAISTHATFFKTGDKEELVKLYENIRQIINNQYIITYETTNLNPSAEVRVKVGYQEDVRTYDNKPSPLWIKSVSLNEKEKDLNARKQDLDARETKLVQEKKELQVLADKIKQREVALQKTQDELNKKRQELDSWNSKLNDLESNLTNIDESQKVKDQRLSALEQQLKDKAKILEDKASKLEEQANLLNGKNQVLENEAKRLKTLETNLNLKEYTLANQRDKLNDLQTALTQQEKNLNDMKLRLSNVEKNLNNRSTDLDSKQKTLDQLNYSLNQREKDLQGQALVLKRRADELDSAQANILAKKQELEDLRKNLALKSTELQVEETKLKTKADAIKKQSDLLVLRAQQLEKEAQTLQAKATELNETETAITREKKRLDDIRKLLNKVLKGIQNATEDLDNVNI